MLDTRGVRLPGTITSLFTTMVLCSSISFDKTHVPFMQSASSTRGSGQPVVVGASVTAELGVSNGNTDGSSGASIVGTDVLGGPEGLEGTDGTEGTDGMEGTVVDGFGS